MFFVSITDAAELSKMILIIISCGITSNPLVLYVVLRHLASSVSRYLAEPPQEVGELDITRDTAASQAHVTFLVLFNNWFPSAQGKVSGGNHGQQEPFSRIWI